MLRGNLKSVLQILTSSIWINNLNRHSGHSLVL